VNDKTYGPYDYVKPYPIYGKQSGPVFSDDSSKYAWIFGKDNKEYIQINEKTYGPYNKDYAIFTFTKDNKVYIAYISGNELVIEEVE
jgi:hypothetical protein